jgi:hypothetical protein
VSGDLLYADLTTSTPFCIQLYQKLVVHETQHSAASKLPGSAEGVWLQCSSSADTMALSGTAVTARPAGEALYSW